MEAIHMAFTFSCLHWSAFSEQTLEENDRIHSFRMPVEICQN